MAYIDLATLKAALGETKTDRDDLLTQAIAAASAAIDERCGRSFDRAELASSRVFRTRGRITFQDDGELLLIDDVADDTNVVVEVGFDDAWSEVTGYELEPFNAIDKGRPITGLLAGAWSLNIRVRVTAVWGWPAVPEQIKQATLLQAMRLYRRKDSPEGVAGSAEWGLIRMPNLDPDVRALVEPFRLPSFGGC